MVKGETGDREIEPTGTCASRWNALLAVHSILLKEDVDLQASLKPPLSLQQIA
jgi:hypothetical protein